MNGLKTFGTLLVAVTMIAGCTSVSRGLGTMTANKYAEARSGTVWVVPPPQLAPPAPDARLVYISYRNISDADIDILPLLRESTQSQGWSITNDPNAAAYRLRVSTRFFGEVEPESGGSSVGQGLGVIVGAATGIGAGMATTRATGSGLAGVGVGLGAGGLVSAGLGNASRPREWALIMDIILEERSDQEIEVTVNTDSGSGAVDVAGSGNARMASGGGTSTSNSSSATTTQKTNYFPHGIRLSVWANQMNMKEEESMPEIETRMRRVVTQMLPM